MVALPKNQAMNDKYYVGYFAGDMLVAILDLIVDCLEENIAFVGFFMMNKEKQGCGNGSLIIEELVNYLKNEGFNSIRLAWIKENMQAAHFW